MRATLLNAAMEVFRESGFGAAAVEDIASRAGVSKTTVYRQYGTKEDLFRAANSSSMGDLRALIERIVDGTQDFPEALLNVLRLFGNHLARPDTLATRRVVIGEAGRFPDVAKQVIRDVNIMLEPLVHFLSSANDEGLIEFDDAAAAARDLLTLMAGNMETLLGVPTTQAQREVRAHSVHTMLLKAWSYRSIP